MDTTIWDNVKNVEAIPAKVKGVVDNWFSHPENYRVLFYWEDDYETFFFVVQAIKSNIISGVRIFPLGNQWEISEDHSIKLR